MKSSNIFWVGILKQFLVDCLMTSDLISKTKLILGLHLASFNIDFPFKINQILDTSRPNIFIISFSLFTELQEKNQTLFTSTFALPFF